MSDYFDRSETRSAKSREAALFREFRPIVSMAKNHAFGLRKQIRSIDISRIKSYQDLARVPTVRKADLMQAVCDEPPYAGVNAARIGAMRHVLAHVATGRGRDWWVASRAMHAAQFKSNDVVLNCGSYHLQASGHMVAEAADSLGCATIAAGPSDVDAHLYCISRFKPAAYCGKPGALRRIVERAGVTNHDISSLTKALVFGAPLSTHFRRQCEARGLRIRQAYFVPEVGVVAYETSAPDGTTCEGMIVNEGVIVEILDPVTEQSVAVGEIGEVTITRLNHDFPVLRMRTGDLSRVIAGVSPCGRTNLRIQGWMGRVEEVVRYKDRMVCPSLVLAMRARHACVRGMRLVVSGSDDIILRAEGTKDDPQLPIKLRTTMQSVLGFEARIDIVPPGVLPRDGKLIVDERARV